MHTPSNELPALHPAVIAVLLRALGRGTPYVGHVVREHLIQTLEAVRAHAVSGELAEEPHAPGLCYQWDRMLRKTPIAHVVNAYDLVPVLALGLPGHSGQLVSPIKLLPGSAAYGPLWEGVYLERRLALIDHILAQLKVA